MSAAVSKFPNLRRVLWTSANPVVSSQSMRKHPYIERVDVKVSNVNSACCVKGYVTSIDVMI